MESILNSDHFLVKNFKAPLMDAVTLLRQVTVQDFIDSKEEMIVLK